MKSFLISTLLFCSLKLTAQQIQCDNPAINAAWKLAVQTVDINTRRGILAAGGDYGGKWTRDIAINSWNGVVLLRPEISEKSLWSVTVNRDTVGHEIFSPNATTMKYVMSSLLLFSDFRNNNHNKNREEYFSNK